MWSGTRSNSCSVLRTVLVPVQAPGFAGGWCCNHFFFFLHTKISLLVTVWRKWQCARHLATTKSLATRSMVEAGARAEVLSCSQLQESCSFFFVPLEFVLVFKNKTCRLKGRDEEQRRSTLTQSFYSCCSETVLPRASDCQGNQIQGDKTPNHHGVSSAAWSWTGTGFAVLHDCCSEQHEAEQVGTRTTRDASVPQWWCQHPGYRPSWPAVVSLNLSLSGGSAVKFNVSM